MTDLRHELCAIARDGSKHPPHPGASRFRYGPWRIERADWIRPHPSVDWDWWHEDYDGPEDHRCGSAGTRDACIAEIHEWEDGE